MRLIPHLVLWTALLLPGLAGAQNTTDPTVRVRVGEHAGFNRVVFDWQARVPYSVESASGRATVHFERPATLDLSRYRRDPPPLVTSLRPHPEGGGLAVEIGMPAGAKLRHFEHGTSVVIDVLAPATGERSAAARPEPASPPLASPPKAAAPVSPPVAAPAPSVAEAPASRPAVTPPPVVSPAPPPEASPSAAPQSRTPAPELAVLDSARVDRSASGLTLGPNIGTLGLGGEAGYRFNDYLGLRIGGNYFSYDFDEQLSEVNYDAEISLQSAGAVLDIYPLGGVFRLTAGARYNWNGLEFTATPTTNITIGGNTFTPAQAGTLRGDVDFWEVAPYAGFGLEGSFFEGRLRLAADFGVLYQGKPHVDLSGTGALAGDPTFLAAIEQEKKDIEDEFAFLGFYPVVGLSLAVRF
jgi:hypothetical protein